MNTTENTLTNIDFLETESAASLNEAGSRLAKSGEMQTFYETDRSEWFDAETAKQKLHSYLSGSIADAILKFNL